MWPEVIPKGIICRLEEQFCAFTAKLEEDPAGGALKQIQTSELLLLITPPLFKVSTSLHAVWGPWLGCLLAVRCPDSSLSSLTAVFSFTPLCTGPQKNVVLLGFSVKGHSLFTSRLIGQ